MFDKERRRQFLAQPWAAYTCAACSAVLLYLGLVHIPDIVNSINYLFSIVSSIIIGAVLAYIINPLVDFFEESIFANIKKKDTRHTLAVWVAFLIIILLITWLVMTLIPSLTDSFMMLFNNINNYAETIGKFMSWLEEKAREFGIDLSKVIDHVSMWVSNLLQSLPSYTTTFISKSAAVGSSVLKWVIGLIFALYFLLGKTFIVSNFTRLRKTLYTDSQYRSRTLFWSRCNAILSQYIGMTILEAIVVGVANAIFMWIFGMPYISLISVIIGATNLLPNIGPIIGCPLGMFILVLNEPRNALLFLVFTVILQTIDGYIIKPKLFGGTLGVPSSGILITIVVGGNLFGIVGILLAIPIAAILTFIYKEYFFPWLLRRKERMGTIERRGK